MISKKERYKLYIDLWDRLHRKGCPVCNLVNEKIEERLRESIHRDSSDRASPLCVHHTRWMAAKNDESGLLFTVRFVRDVEDWIRKTLERDQRLPGPRRFFNLWTKGGDHRPPWYPSSRCDACRLQKSYERSIIAVLLDALTDPDFDRVFRESEGLCLHHLFHIDRVFPGRGGVSAVLEMQLRKLEDLRNAVSPHHFQPDRTAPPADPAAWKQVLSMLGTDPEDDGYRDLESSAVSVPESSEITETPAGAISDDPGDRLDLEPFEKEKWRRAMRSMQKRLSEENTRATSLHYRLWKALEENKALRLNLAGSEARSRFLEERLAKMKEENDEEKSRVETSQGKNTLHTD